MRDMGATSPQHVAIIMDGNGRWARMRGMPRTLGHKAGLEAVRRVVRCAGDCGITTLTLYAFSSENWARPPQEVRELMALLRLFIRKDLAELEANGIHVKILGRRDNLQADIKRLVQEAEDRTKHNDRLTLNVAFNYGGRDEIARAVDVLIRQRLAEPAKLGHGVTPEEISNVLDTRGQSDPDLVIRTSGEKRLSNFLTWQCAYSEFVFQDVYWPDYDETHLRDAIAEYMDRDRRFGGLSAVEKADIAL
ncbi:MAG: isoprenyl transferase [Pseudomonadota bacterium]